MKGLVKETKTCLLPRRRYAPFGKRLSYEAVDLTDTFVIIIDLFLIINQYLVMNYTRDI